MAARGVTRARTIATEACRSAANGADFVAGCANGSASSSKLSTARPRRISPRRASAISPTRTPARRLCSTSAADPRRSSGWLRSARAACANRVKAWESLRLGVVSLAETFGGVDVSDEAFAAMTAHVSEALAPFVARVADEARCDRFHLLGTSGTVTTIAGVHLNLPRYDRRAVDGLWLGRPEVDEAIARLRAMSYAERAANACIGHERADLVLAGCAILEAIRNHFPAERLRIADRGLREGILSHMMRADGVGPHRRPRERW